MVLNESTSHKDVFATGWVEPLQAPALFSGLDVLKTALVPWKKHTTRKGRGREEREVETTENKNVTTSPRPRNVAPA